MGSEIVIYEKVVIFYRKTDFSIENMSVHIFNLFLSLAISLFKDGIQFTNY